MSSPLMLVILSLCSTTHSPSFVLGTTDNRRACSRLVWSSNSPCLMHTCSVRSFFEKGDSSSTDIDAKPSTVGRRHSSGRSLVTVVSIATVQKYGIIRTVEPRPFACSGARCMYVCMNGAWFRSPVVLCQDRTGRYASSSEPQTLGPLVCVGSLWNSLRCSNLRLLGVWRTCSDTRGASSLSFAAELFLPRIIHRTCFFSHNLSSQGDVYRSGGFYLE